MKKRVWQCSLRLLLLLMLAVAIRSYWFRPRNINVAYRIDRFGEMLEHASGDTFQVAYIQASNLSWDSIWYRGVTQDQPDFSMYQ